MVISHLLLNSLVKAHLRERLARIFHVIVEWRLSNLRQRFLVRLIQTLHLDVGVLNRLFISISISFFALPWRVLVVVLVQMYLEGWILFSLLLDQLEVIVTESTLRARRCFPAETASC